MNPSSTYSSSFFNTQSTLWSLPSQPNLKNKKLKLQFSKSEKSFVPLSSCIIPDFKKYYIKQKNQLSLIQRYNKSPRPQTLMQFYTQAQSEIKNLNSLLSYKNKNNKKHQEEQNEVLFNFYKEENGRNRNGRFSDDEGEDENEKKERKKFLMTHGLIGRISKEKKEELRRQGMNMFKYTGGINVKDITYKNQIKSYKMMMINNQIEKKIWLNTTENQITKYLSENTNSLTKSIKSQLMPKIKVINTINMKNKKRKIEKTNTIATESATIISQTQNQTLPEYENISRDKMFELYNIIPVKFNSRFIVTPSSRRQAKMVLYYRTELDQSKVIYMFGGVGQGKLNELWKCNCTQYVRANYDFYNPFLHEKPKVSMRFKWSQINNTKIKLAKRTGHTMCIYKDELLIYGGIIDEESESFETKKDLVVYNITNNNITLKTFHSKPIPKWRRNQIAEMIGKYMIIFGGIAENSYDGSVQILNDFWSLHVGKLTWKKINTTGVEIPPLHSMSSCLILYSLHRQDEGLTPFKLPELPDNVPPSNLSNEGIFIFGGIDEKGRCVNSLYVLKISKPNTIVQPSLKGIPPCPRVGCSMHYYNKLNVIILFGGRNEKVSNSNGYFNDFWFIDLEMMQWVKLNCDTDLEGRADYSSVINDDFLIIFGGSNGSYFHKSDLLLANLHLLKSDELSNSIINKKETSPKKERTNSLISKNRKMSDSQEGSSSRRKKESISVDDKERGIANQFYMTYHTKSKDLEDQMRNVFKENQGERQYSFGMYY